MKFKLKGLTAQNEKIELSKPVWFEHLIENFGATIKFKFFFLKPIPYEITQLIIQKNEEPPQTFIVDQLEQLNRKNKPAIFTLTVSSPLNFIWQNYVKPEIFATLSVNELFEKFCKPFQIQSINPTLQNNTSTQTNFFTTLGMTYWDVVTLFFKKNFNTTIFINKNNQITTKFKNPNLNPITTNDPYLTSLKNLTDRTQILSTLLIQLPDSSANNFNEIAHENPVAEKLKINRTKFFKLPKHFTMLPKIGAQTIIDQHNASHKIIELQFAKILEPILWPGTIVELINRDQKLNLCVNSFYTALLNNGPITNIKFFMSSLII